MTPWLLRLGLWLPELLVLKFAVHLRLLNGELIRKLPTRGFRNLQALTGRDARTAER